MRLTAKELDEMQSVNIGAVSADALADVSGMAFDRTLPPGGAAGPVRKTGRQSLLL